MIKLIKKEASRASISEAREKAKAIFDPKPYPEEFKNLRMIASVFLPVLGGLSIVTGFSLLFFIFAKSMHVAVAGILAGIILLLLELLKTETVKHGFLAFYKKTNAIPFFAFAVVLLVLSAFLSVKGAEELNKALDKKIINTENKTAGQMDSLRKFFEGKEKALAQEKKEFYGRANWQGRIDVYDKTTASEIANFQKKEQNLAKEKAQILAQFQEKAQKDVSNLATESNFDITLWVALAAINEFFIILAVWFLVFYRYRTYIEQKALSLTDNTEELYSQFIRFLNLGVSEELSPPAQLHKIGFNLANVSQKVEQKNEQDSEQDYRGLSQEQKIELIKIDIKNGIKDYRTLMKKYGVRIQTIKLCREEVE